ncbi:hypothetical protein NNJEOMEG_02541 [Fundidesulfovibrio magnetotacticus]|uniref:Uncharacterized protein n=1 Tax=Fundidesulfovibrio magnetotacticus TaxID=2730080 RepID=A0A6V8LSH3_9BACT|nr:hypothetical protein [Fundidesulfovibrio magnetotacticus]GFK94694.1 hypothetical protein NNJEOMEG_02541 [Fundidesulfovibrio magnetotacticus]
MVVCETEGRVRFRDAALKAEDIGNTVREALRKTPGVLRTEVNRRVGSLLVLYDKASIGLKDILEKIAQALGVDPEMFREHLKNLQRTLAGVGARRNVKRGMLGALGLALGGLLVHEGLHVAAGAVFAALLAAHLYQNRRTLMR